jgi:hypothetical protein
MLLPPSCGYVQTIEPDSMNHRSDIEAHRPVGHLRSPRFLGHQRSMIGHNRSLSQRLVATLQAAATGTKQGWLGYRPRSGSNDRLRLTVAVVVACLVL